MYACSVSQNGVFIKNVYWTCTACLTLRWRWNMQSLNLFCQRNWPPHSISPSYTKGQDVLPHWTQKMCQFRVLKEREREKWIWKRILPQRGIIMLAVTSVNKKKFCTKLLKEPQGSETADNFCFFLFGFQYFLNLLCILFHIKNNTNYKWYIFKSTHFQRGFRRPLIVEGRAAATDQLRRGR